MKNYSGEQI